MGLFSWLRGSSGGPDPDSPDALLGTGLWRQHRDRFGRAVDRLYDTAVQAQRESPQAPAAQSLVELTHRMADLDEKAAQVAQAAHAAWPLDDLVMPAEARQRVGDLPELLSRAGGKASEAAQAAAHVRVALRMSAVDGTGSHGDEVGEEAARSSAQFVDDAAQLIESAQSRLRGMEG